MAASALGELHELVELLHHVRCLGLIARAFSYFALHCRQLLGEVLGFEGAAVRFLLD